MDSKGRFTFAGVFVTADAGW